MGDSTKNRETVTLTCHGCGKVFQRKAHRLRKTFSYCGRACINYSLGTRKKRPYEWLYNKLVFYGGFREIEIALTFEQFLLFVDTKKCFYCDADIIWVEHHNKGSANSAYNLDRINALEGYRPDNLVVCCKRCNYGKGDRFTFDEWVKIGATIRAFTS